MENVVRETVNIKRPNKEEIEKMAETGIDFEKDMVQFAKNIQLLFEENKEALLMLDTGLVFSLSMGGDIEIELKIGHEDGVNNCIRNLDEIK